MRYKVLDVREYITEEKYHIHVVIASDINTHERKRFEFFKGRETNGLGGTRLFYGNSGDYDLLVPGDLFTIEKEHGYDKIVLI